MCKLTCSLQPKAKGKVATEDLTPAERKLVARIDKLKKLLKDCGITYRPNPNHTLDQRLERLSELVAENEASTAHSPYSQHCVNDDDAFAIQIDLSWSLPQRTEYKVEREKKREMEDLLANRNIMASSDKRKKAKVDYSAKLAAPGADDDDDEDGDDVAGDDDGSLFSDEASD